MNSKIIIAVLTFELSNFACRNDANIPLDKAIPVGDNTFVYKEKVYKILNNELLVIGNLNDSSIRKLELSKPALNSLGTESLDFIKKGSTAGLSTVYRGNSLYYKFWLAGINDLKERYAPGKFTLTLMDQFGFTIYSVDIPTYELVGEVDPDNNIVGYSNKGKIEISLDAQEAISRFEVVSTVKAK